MPARSSETARQSFLGVHELTPTCVLEKATFSRFGLCPAVSRLASLLLLASSPFIRPLASILKQLTKEREVAPKPWPGPAGLQEERLSG